MPKMMDSEEILSALAKRIEGLVPELIKKELGGRIAARTERTKNEIYEIIAREINAYLERLDIASVVRKVLSGLSLEIKAEITFRHQDARPKVKARLKGKANK